MSRRRKTTTDSLVCLWIALLSCRDVPACSASLRARSRPPLRLKEGAGERDGGGSPELLNLPSRLSGGADVDEAEERGDGSPPAYTLRAMK